MKIKLLTVRNHSYMLVEKIKAILSRNSKKPSSERLRRETFDQDFLSFILSQLEVNNRMESNPLNEIMGVQEAAQMWGLSADHVKRLCRDKKVIARNIGKTWILVKNQTNPKTTK